MAKIKSDAHLYLTETGDAAPAPVALTSVTNTDPAVVTLAAAMPADAADGDLAKFAGTGQAAVGALGTVQIFQKAGDLALLEVCMVTITVAGVPPDSIAMDDMCGSTTVL